MLEFAILENQLDQLLHEPSMENKHRTIGTPDAFILRKLEPCREDKNRTLGTPDAFILRNFEEDSSPSVKHLSLYGQLLHAAHFFFSFLQRGISFFKFR